MKRQRKSFYIPAWKHAGGFRVQLPLCRHALPVFAAILVCMSCTKEMPDDWVPRFEDDTRWWVNTELPVPVTFSFASGTKGHAIESVEQLEGMEFGMFAAGDYQREDPVLYDGKAMIRNGKVVFAESEDGSLYYPRSSKNDYSFYAYYTGPGNSGYSVSKTEDGRYVVPVDELGKDDILVSVPSVATPIYEPGNDEPLSGFNAVYARASYLWYGNLHVPKLEFRHACSAIQFHIRYRKYRDYLPNVSKKVTTGRLDYVPVSAQLDLSDGTFETEGGLGSIIQDEDAAPTPDGIMLDNTFFIAPGEYPQIEFGFTLVKLLTYNIRVSHEDIAGAMNGNVVFERGGRYVFDVLITEKNLLGTRFGVELNPYRK